MKGEFSHVNMGLRGTEPVTKTVRLTCLCDKCKEGFELVLTKKQVEALWKSFKHGAIEATGFLDDSLEKTYARFKVERL
jgi:hypothetical protein